MLVLLLIACEPAAMPAPTPDTLPVSAPVESLTGTVAETLPGGSYTYARIHPTVGPDAWAAAPGEAPALGSKVTISTSMPMENFHSDTLERDFALVYFVQTLGAVATPASVPAATARTALGQVDTHTVAAVLADRLRLSGQTVTVTGEVVKSTSGVLKRNWLHIKGVSGTEDLTVTSADTAAVGERVQVTGTIAVDQDFGSGYSYPVMVTDAVLTLTAG